MSSIVFPRDLAVDSRSMLMTSEWQFNGSVCGVAESSICCISCSRVIRFLPRRTLEHHSTALDNRGVATSITW